LTILIISYYMIPVMVLLNHKGFMGNMGAACIASAGFGMTKGNGVSITTFPIVPHL